MKPPPTGSSGTRRSGVPCSVPCSGILKWERRRGTRQPGPRGTSQNRRRRPKRRILTSRTTIGSHFYVTFPIRPFALIGQARIAPQADPLRQAVALPQNSSLFKAAAGTKRLPASSGCRRQAAAGSKRPPPLSGSCRRAAAPAKRCLPATSGRCRQVSPVPPGPPLTSSRRCRSALLARRLMPLVSLCWCVQILLCSSCPYMYNLN